MFQEKKKSLSATQQPSSASPAKSSKAVTEKLTTVTAEGEQVEEDVVAHQAPLPAIEKSLSGAALEAAISGPDSTASTAPGEEGT